MSELDYLSFWERLQLGQAIGWLTSAETPTPILIAKLEQAALEHPTRWIIHYTLGDYCFRLARYADALRANLKCEELRPLDVRTMYALGTVYRYMASAKFLSLSAEQRAQWKNSIAYFDLERAGRALQELGMTPLQAAREAIRWMNKACGVAYGRDVQAHLRENVAVIKRQFPELSNEDAFTAVAAGGSSSVPPSPTNVPVVTCMPTRHIMTEREFTDWAERNCFASADAQRRSSELLANPNLASESWRKAALAQQDIIIGLSAEASAVCPPARFSLVHQIRCRALQHYANASLLIKTYIDTEDESLGDEMVNEQKAGNEDSTTGVSMLNSMP